jgi:hypothetical protein
MYLDAAASTLYTTLFTIAISLLDRASIVELTHCPALE